MALRYARPLVQGRYSSYLGRRNAGRPTGSMGLVLALCLWGIEGPMPNGRNGEGRSQGAQEERRQEGGEGDGGGPTEMYARLGMLAGTIVPTPKRNEWACGVWVWWCGGWVCARTCVCVSMCGYVCKDGYEMDMGMESSTSH